MIAIQGSELIHLPGSHKVAPASPDQIIRVTLVVRPKKLVPILESHSSISRVDFSHKYGADPVLVAGLKDAYHQLGLQFLYSDAARRVVVFNARLSTVAAAFGVEFYEYAAGTIRYRGYEGPVLIPDQFNNQVIAVLGLDTLPLGKPEQPKHRNKKKAQDGGDRTVQELAALYEFPETDGAGQCVGIISFEDYDATDVNAFFNGQPPKIARVPLSGGSSTAFFETTCDIEVVGALVPRATLAVYVEANRNSDGWYEAVTSAIHDATNAPSVVTISWGAWEGYWPKSVLAAMKQAFADSPVLGVTVFAAAGDLAGGVDYPAADPCVMACGGTVITTNGGIFQAETAWENTNGGVSAEIPVPAWQAKAGVPAAQFGDPNYRGVPDVAGCAMNVACFVDGAAYSFGGTSAAAPLWAGLIARINSSLNTHVGFIAPQVYANPGAFCRDVVAGRNSQDSAQPGWDPCTGWGSPRGLDALQALSAGSKKNTPQLRS